MFLFHFYCPSPGPQERVLKGVREELGRRENKPFPGGQPWTDGGFYEEDS